MPEDADLSKIKAEYKNGVLAVRIDRMEQAKAQTVKINIK